MRLVHIAGGAPAVPFAALDADLDLAGDVQLQLAQAGLLAPPPDRRFGPVSRWALQEFLAHWGLAGAREVDRPVASALLQADAAFGMVPGDDLAGAIVRAMQAAGHWVCRHPAALNIVYVEGMGLDGRPLRAAQALFDDARLLLRVGDAGRPEIAGAWEGAIAPGEMPALFGQFLLRLEQHGAHDASAVASTGLVGRTLSGHREFLAMLRKDPRQRADSACPLPTSVLPAAAVLAARG